MWRGGAGKASLSPKNNPPVITQGITQEMPKVTYKLPLENTPQQTKDFPEGPTS